ncbi:hypothetical protein WJX81_007485 [Elliptochloris bilobata]|uniref:Uncharacterized protein n=1 Tax=Elliptochloris bilobata TaxID=381761 RepID=A0AAW1RXZ8_9CHLO
MTTASAFWPNLATYRSGCNACERELLDIFLAESSGPADTRGRQADGGIWRPPALPELLSSVRSYLGVYCIKELDVMNVLKAAGIYDPANEQESACSPDELAREWLPRVYSGAATVVLGLLRLLAECGVYEAATLQPAVQIAELSVEELPCCAMLAEYLPGPAQVRVSSTGVSACRGDRSGGGITLTFSY